MSKILIRMEGKRVVMLVIGILLIVGGVTGVVFNMVSGTAFRLLWLCNHANIILGLAFIFGSSFWASAEINLIFFPQLFWTIDFLSKLLFGRFVFGFTDYMFSPAYEGISYALSLSHLFVLPIAFVGLWFLKSSKDGWKGSVLHGILLIPISLAFTTANLNCMRESCISFIPSGIVYQILWPFAIFAAVLIVNFFLWKIFGVRNERR